MTSRKKQSPSRSAPVDLWRVYPDEPGSIHLAQDQNWVTHLPHNEGDFQGPLTTAG